MDLREREALISALAAGASKAAAGRAAGLTREHVSRLMSPTHPMRDEQLQAEIVRRRAELVVVPEVATPAATEKARASLVDAISSSAIECVERGRAILAIDSHDPKVMQAQAQVMKILLDVAGRPAPVGALRVRAENGDRAIEAEVTGGGLAGLVGKILAAGGA